MRRMLAVKNKLRKIIKYWKSIWGKLIAFIICGSIVALFIASFYSDKTLTLSVMNEWVSLVVGMAALILGIISLFLSFYNVEQSNEVQQNTIQIMNDVKEEFSKKINDMQMSMNDNFSEIKRNSNYRGSTEISKMEIIKNDREEWREVDETVSK